MHMQTNSTSIETENRILLHREATDDFPLACELAEPCCPLDQHTLEANLLFLKEDKNNDDKTYRHDLR